MGLLGRLAKGIESTGDRDTKGGAGLPTYPLSSRPTRLAASCCGRTREWGYSLLLEPKPFDAYIQGGIPKLRAQHGCWKQSNRPAGLSQELALTVDSRNHPGAGKVLVDHLRPRDWERPQRPNPKPPALGRGEKTQNRLRGVSERPFQNLACSLGVVCL